MIDPIKVVKEIKKSYCISFTIKWRKIDLFSISTDPFDCFYYISLVYNVGVFVKLLFSRDILVEK